MENTSNSTSIHQNTSNKSDKSESVSSSLTHTHLDETLTNNESSAGSFQSSRSDLPNSNVNGLLERTSSTVLRFAKRLQKNLKETFPEQEFKLAKCQEIMAKIYSYRDLHESQVLDKKAEIHQFDIVDEKTGESSRIVTRNGEISYQKLDNILDNVSPVSIQKNEKIERLKYLLLKSNGMEDLEEIRSLFEKMKTFVFSDEELNRMKRYNGRTLDTPEKMNDFLRNRNIKCVSEECSEFGRQTFKFRCNNGHEWVSKFSFYKEECGCPTCGLSVFENGKTLEDLENQYKKAALDIGLELIGPGKNPKYRMYRWLNTGHEGEYLVSSVNSGKVRDCQIVYPFKKPV